MIPCDWCVKGAGLKPKPVKKANGIPVWHIPDDGSTHHVVLLCTNKNHSSKVAYPPVSHSQVFWEGNRTLALVTDENGKGAQLVWYETGSNRAKTKADDWAADGTLSTYAITVCRSGGSTKYTANALKLSAVSGATQDMFKAAIDAWANR
jgi:hypothetical protein